MEHRAPAPDRRPGRGQLTPERWEQVKALFFSAIERPPGERAGFLASACGGDGSLREEVERLLQSHDQAGSFIESPAIDLARSVGDQGTPVTASLHNDEPASPASPAQKSDHPAPAAFSPGDVAAGRYRILRFIARGGMGEVYEAEDLALQGRVALKTIRPDIAEDARALERFKREIHVARKVTHPNVCRIYDLGTHRPLSPEGAAGPREILFLTMELLSGETLSERIRRRGRLSTDEALPITAQIAAGLDAAHATGVIHRDFKSANVLLVTDPHMGTRAVVTDFGLARASSAEASLVSISDSSQVAGTPAYMAPEQVQALPLTHAADLYAFGIVMYEMLTGVRPFDGGSAFSVAARRLTEAPRPPHDHVPGLDPVWEYVILRCLEREPRARFASAGEIPKVLSGQVPTPSPGIAPAATAPTVPGPGRNAARRRRLRRVEVAAATALAAGVAAGYWLLRAGSPSSPATSPAGSGSAAVAPVSPRHAVAVLGFKNNSGQADAAWLSTAISEMLATELAAGAMVRVVPGEEVARIKLDLALDDSENLTPAALERIRKSLRADLVALGSYTMLGGLQSRLLRIDLRLQDAKVGEVVASAGATGSETQLFDLVSRAAAALRQKLGLGEVSPAEAVAMQASLPSNPEAMRFYLEGLAQFRLLDSLAARALLEKAVAADPRHPLPHAALAEAWSALGYEDKARIEAQKAAELAGNLPRDQRLSLEARRYETAKEWERAIETHRVLFDSFPDSLEHGLRLASAQTLGGKPKDALVTVERLRKLPSPASADPRIDLAEARAFEELGDSKRQQALAATAAEKAKAQGARLLVAQARSREAAALGNQGELDSATAAAEEARGLYAAVGDRGGTARMLEQIAIFRYRRGDLEGARRLFDKSLSTYREIGDKKSLARVAHNMGNVLLGQGKLLEAERIYQESLVTFRAIGAKREEAQTLCDLGAGLYNSGELARAQKRYEEALALFGEIGNKPGVAMTLTNLAEVLYAKGDLSQAENMHQESLAINREIGDKAGAAYDLFRLGEVLAAKGDLLVARDRYQEALAGQDSLGEKTAAAQTRLGLAALLIEQGRPAEAEALAREAEEVVRTEKAADLEASAQMVLARCFLAQRKLAEAQKAGERFEALSRSSEDRRVRIAAASMGARLRAASGQELEIAAALKALQGALGEATRAGFVDHQFEARLAMGEIEMASGRATAGRARLNSLEKEASTKGFGLVARRAASAVNATAARNQ